MQVKLLELRDEGTFIPLLCVDMNPEVELTPRADVVDVEFILGEKPTPKVSERLTAPV